MLDVAAEKSVAGSLAGSDREGKGRFAVVMPSETFGARPETGRKLVLVVDRSGSMQGKPMAQAIRAIEACLGGLAEDDRFGLIAFDDKVETFRHTLAAGTIPEREAARKFLAGIDARGGTELARALLEAAKILGSGGGDILVMTDGQVFGTEKILEQARGAGVRIHCLGIGSASQDRFLAMLARHTGGVSRFLTPRERVDLPAVDLFASVGRPVASGLSVEGAIAVTELPANVFAGTPLVFFGEAALDSTLRIQWSRGERRDSNQQGIDGPGRDAAAAHGSAADRGPGEPDDGTLARGKSDRETD